MILVTDDRKTGMDLTKLADIQKSLSEYVAWIFGNSKENATFSSNTLSFLGD